MIFPLLSTTTQNKANSWDAGDGRITVTEFLDGAIRLRGLAKSVDLAQAPQEVLVYEQSMIHGCSYVFFF